MNFNEREKKQSSIKQSINLSSNLVNEVGLVTQRINQQQHQASSASMCAAPSFDSSPCLPSDLSTFRVSLFKYGSANSTDSFYVGRKETPAEVRPAASLMPMIQASYGMWSDIDEIYWGYLKKHEKAIITFRNKNRENMGTLWESASNVAVIPSH